MTFIEQNVREFVKGKEHLYKNQNSFDASVEVLKNNGILLIFIEGICLNKNEIQPFKKGASRILQQAVAAGVTPAVLPAVITYNGFKHFGKKIYNFFILFTLISWICF